MPSSQQSFFFFFFLIFSHVENMACTGLDTKMTEELFFFFFLAIVCIFVQVQSLIVLEARRGTITCLPIAMPCRKMHGLSPEHGGPHF